MIAIRIAKEQGADVSSAAEVSDYMWGDYRSVLVPDRIPDVDPGGIFVRVHKQTGEAKIEMSL